MHWVGVTGALFAGFTLLFFAVVALLAALGVVRNVGREAQKLIVVVLAFGAALSFGFIGGQVMARVRLLPALARGPRFVFNLSGGILVLLVVLLGGLKFYVEPADGPRRRQHYQSVERQTDRIQTVLNANIDVVLSFPQGGRLSADEDATRMEAVDRKDAQALIAELKDDASRLAVLIRECPAPATSEESRILTVARDALLYATGGDPRQATLTQAMVDEQFRESSEQLARALRSSFFLAERLIREARWAEALEVYSRYLKHKPEDADILLKLANCHIQLAHQLRAEGKSLEEQHHAEQANHRFLQFLYAGRRTERELHFDGSEENAHAVGDWRKVVYFCPTNYARFRMAREPDPTHGTILTIETKRASVAAARLNVMDLSKDPTLSWTWKAEKLPVEGDVTFGMGSDFVPTLSVRAVFDFFRTGGPPRRDDQACQVVLGFAYEEPDEPRPRLTKSPIMLNYVWDTTAKVETLAYHLQPPQNSPNVMLYVVATSSTNSLDRWVHVSRNLVADLRALRDKFGEVRVREVGGSRRKMRDMLDPLVEASGGRTFFVAVQANSQWTQSESRGSFAKLTFGPPE
ncbi:MAG: DUF3047 domain-containing protein [Verrucomicrobiales bacterium]|nr:DUF3047 domain-containing protein [Verrucomicrobiales bacterium]